MVVVLFSACGKPHECIGEWEGDFSRISSVKLKVGKNGHYSLHIYDRGVDKQFRGEWEKISDNTISLPSDCFSTENNNGGVTIHNASNTFFLRSDGAFANSEPELNEPIGYLTKVSDNLD